ncbi:MAG: hypothetical protein EB084_20415 [Proteobacteria bacterium]|nr:hypothetical protein [Pseudomonadota bacterium]
MKPRTSLAALLGRWHVDPLCGSPAQIQQDKKFGRPFVICAFCGSRTFFKSVAGLAGWLTMSRLAEANIANLRASMTVLMEELSSPLPKADAQPQPAPQSAKMAPGVDVFAAGLVPKTPLNAHLHEAAR